MAETPLSIIRDDANATAQFFGAVNTAIARSAAAELQAAQQASQIVDTTFRAKELKRTNDQNIRSTILRDELLEKQDNRNEQIFNYQMANRDEDRRFELLRRETELELNQLAVNQKRSEIAQKSLLAQTAAVQTEALQKAAATGDYSYVTHYANLLNQGAADIINGGDHRAIGTAINRAFRDFESNIVPEVSDYNPAYTQAISQIYGQEQAQNYERLNNPNLQASYRAQLVRIASGQATPTEIRAYETGQMAVKPEDRPLVARAVSEIDMIETRIKEAEARLGEMTKGEGLPRYDNDQPIPDLFSGKMSTPEQILSKRGAEGFAAHIKAYQAQISALQGYRQQVINALAAGTEIPDFTPPSLGAVGTTGSTGQTGSNIPAIIPAEPTEEQLESARNNVLTKPEPFESKTEAIRRMENVGRIDPGKKRQLSFDDAVKSINEDFGLRKLLSGVAEEGRRGMGTIEDDILKNIRDLSDDEFVKVFYEGDLLSKISKRRTEFERRSPFEAVLGKILSPITGEGSTEAGRARLLKRRAKGLGIDDSQLPDLEKALAEALAEEVIERTR